MAYISPSSKYVVNTHDRFDIGQNMKDYQHRQPVNYFTYKGYAQNENPCLPMYGANVDNFTTKDLPKINPEIVDNETKLSNRGISYKEGLDKYVNMTKIKHNLPLHVCNNELNKMQTNTRVNSPATQNRVKLMDRTYALQKDPQIAAINEPCWIRYPANTKYETQNELNPYRRYKKQKINFNAEKYKHPNIYIPEYKKPTFI